MPFPSVYSSFNRPLATDRLNSPSHSSLHNTQSSAIGQLEAVVGLADSSSVLGTLIGDLRSPGSSGGGHIQAANTGGTGQTSYTKGDMLVAQSSSVISKLAIGSDALVLTADSSQATGVKWSSPAAVNVQSFLSSGNWSRPGGVTPASRTFIEIWGGGGGGGQASVNGVAAGGGGGTYMSGWYTSSVLASTVAINIGLGGTGGSQQSDGSVGGITVFGPATSILTAYGGGGGSGTANPAGAGGGGTGGGLFMSGFTQGVNAVSETSVYGGYGGIPAGSAKTLPSPGNYVGGAGGGGGGGAGASVYGIGAKALYGGSGGGGVTSSFMGNGGSALGGGAGGNGSVVGSGVVTAASVPGGGGGGGYGTGGVGGVGAAGKAIIVTFL